MIRLVRPNDVIVREYHAQCQQATISFHDVGTTKRLLTDGLPPPGFELSRYSRLLGQGPRCYRAACESVRSWKMFANSMTSIFGGNSDLMPGTNVVVRIRAYGLWTLNGARIVYQLDEGSSDREQKRFGFAYVALPGHVMEGEECFYVELGSDGEVRFHITVVARPASIWMTLGKPFVARQQRRFRRLAGEAMLRAVS